ncbi:MAG: GTP-binding protein [Euryarchaeota archaeon]|nr:GTP-binding protein [Euryarchaeota archaeon]
MAEKGISELDEFVDWFLTEEEAAEAATRQVTVMKKVCMLGDPAVGKTSLVARFVFSMFDDRYIETIGAKVTKRTMAIENKASGERYRLKLMIWDIAGQKTLDFIKPTYYRDAEGALVIADCTRRETLDNVSRWATSIREVCGEIPLVVLVNKSDLREHSLFSMQEAEQVASGLGAPAFPASAKTGENVANAFSNLGRRLIRDTLKTGLSK